MTAPYAGAGGGADAPAGAAGWVEDWLRGLADSRLVTHEDWLCRADALRAIRCLEGESRGRVGDLRGDARVATLGALWPDLAASPCGPLGAHNIAEGSVKRGPP